jgi:hypothetical protein
MQSSACADVNIWSGNEKERSCWRDGRGIRQIEEKISEKIGEKMGEKMGEKIDEKMVGKMGGKMGQKRCEGERETARVSSSVSVVVKCTVITDSGRLAWEDGTSFGPLVKS